MRKVCFIITSEIHYARNRLILEELRARKDIDLQIVVGGGAILDFYGNVPALLERDGFPCNAQIIMVLQGGSPVAMAKTTGIGVTEFATAFDNLKPDIVLVRGDRYEVLAAAIAAAYLNIPVAHVEGGDVTGTIDESVRHAITKLAHLHFTTNEPAKERVLRMGEHPDYVWNVGSPEIEFLALAQKRFRADAALVNEIGVGDVVDVSKPYLLVMKHPVTSEMGKNRQHVEEVLHAVHELEIPTIWFWPNVDAGTDETSKGIRSFRENVAAEKMRFIKYLPPENFYGLLLRSACLVGNSSTGMKECSYLGVPVVNVGTRQDGRTRGEHIIDVGYDREEIREAINRQLKHGKYPPNEMFYKPDTSRCIVDIIEKVQLYNQKRFYETG